MKVVTAVVNNPIFIQIQYYTLKKYMKCDYEFIVFNDAKDFKDFTNSGDLTIKPLIQQMCQKLNIQCINIPNKHHNLNHRMYKEAGIRTADSMNYILEYQKHNPDTYLLLDSDMFLIDNFYIEDYIKYDCSVVLQKRKKIDKITDIHYIWNGLYYFNTYKLGNLNLMNWNCLPTTDTGGMMTTWLNTKITEFPDIEEIRKNDNIILEKNNIHFIKYLASLEWNINDLPENITNNEKLVLFLLNDPRNVNNRIFSEIYDNKFFHYRAGGNWENKDLKQHIQLSYKLRDALLD